MKNGLDMKTYILQIAVKQDLAAALPFSWTRTMYIDLRTLLSLYRLYIII